ncbi:hypothetical protein [Paenibacillus thalictri]|uniref:Uncharacterized protein n=1 Tax=Paenibacillus thalictri TaxID=2527873 RepID=A0A4Q9DXG1_9BACL|nr:hypothetical protein [Paenibacillus thalictri]TBL79921.1 hypothetical protein EYB31_10045 [Paenibacillus thalictri]
MTQSNKFFITTVTAAFLFGGAWSGALIPKAFAEDAAVSAAASQASTQDPIDAANQAGIQLDLDHIVDNSATILDMDYADLKDLLASGKSLMEIAQYSESNQQDFESSIISISLQGIDNAINNGLLSGDQSAQLISEVRQRISSAINQAGYQDPVPSVPQAPVVDPAQSVDLGLDKIVALSTIYLNMEYIDVEDALKDGKSLDDIAQSAGKSDSFLKSQLLDYATQNIQSAVNNETISDEQAADLKTKAEAAVVKALATPGYQDHV